MQSRGTYTYTVKYWQEKVDAAIADEQQGATPHDHTSDYYDEVEGDTYTNTGNAGSTMVYETKTYNGFYFKTTVSEPEGGKVPESNEGVINVYYDRDEHYKFVCRSNTQTPESAGTGSPVYRIE